MATAKFIGESPYAHNSARRHHESDYKYREYADNVALAQTSAAPRVQLAIFGLGRAGGIHLANIVANPRVKVSCDWRRAGHVTTALTSDWSRSPTSWSPTKPSGSQSSSGQGSIYFTSVLDKCNN